MSYAEILVTHKCSRDAVPTLISCIKKIQYFRPAALFSIIEREVGKKLIQFELQSNENINLHDQARAFQPTVQQFVRKFESFNPFHGTHPIVSRIRSAARERRLPHTVRIACKHSPDLLQCGWAWSHIEPAFRVNPRKSGLFAHIMRLENKGWNVPNDFFFDVTVSSPAPIDQIRAYTLFAHKLPPDFTLPDRAIHFLSNLKETRRNRKYFDTPGTRDRVLIHRIHNS